jgi:hypothetical protein
LEPIVIIFIRLVLVVGIFVVVVFILFHFVEPCRACRRFVIALLVSFSIILIPLL